MVDINGRGLKGKVVIVTGAGKGIGRTIALALADDGARLSLIDISSEALEETSSELSVKGAEFKNYVADVRDSDAMLATVWATFRNFGSLDCAVNNAGILGKIADIDEYPLDAFRRVIDVNLMGVMNCLQAELKVMIGQGHGAIVNMASAAGLVGWAGASAYVAAKHAVVGLTKTAGLEYAARNIRVNSVCPAFVYSDLIAEIISENDSFNAVVDNIPVGRIGQPSEVAEAVLWLLSDRSSFAVGSNLALDGGYTAQ